MASRRGVLHLHLLRFVSKFKAIQVVANPKSLDFSFVGNFIIVRAKSYCPSSSLLKIAVCNLAAWVVLQTAAPAAVWNDDE